MKIIVIGAGIFGVTTALELAKKHDVTLVDSNSDIMQNASKVNHNRLHFGFHYPRSKATARQCLDSYWLFHDRFKDAITSDFENYYMIEKDGHITSEQYEGFCNDLHLEYKKQYPEMDIDFDRIESSYLTSEPIFDYDVIKSMLEWDLMESDVNLVLNKRISSKKDLEGYDVIINTSYFNINKIKRILNLPRFELRFQTVIIPIFRFNHKPIGLTIMDGKFCSVMPKGFNQDEFLLYHAGESVIYETKGTEIPDLWYIGKKIIRNDYLKENIYDKFIALHYINKIANASEKYFRFLKDCYCSDYWQTVRVLPINQDDERLSVFNISQQGDQKIISVLSGKISTCLTIANEINKSI